MSMVIEGRQFAPTHGGGGNGGGGNGGGGSGGSGGGNGGGQGRQGIIGHAKGFLRQHPQQGGMEGGCGSGSGGNGGGQFILQQGGLQFQHGG